MKNKYNYNLKKYAIPWSEAKKKLNFPEQEEREIQEGARYLIALMELRKRRKQLRLSQEALAKKAGITRETLVRIESGKKNTTIETLMKIAHVMDKSIRIQVV